MAEHSFKLARTFLDHWRQDERPTPAPYVDADADSPAATELEQSLAQLVATAKSAWPQIELSEELFIQHVADRIGEPDDLPTAIGQLRAADLYLTCGCAQGDSVAIASFNQRYRGLFEACLVRLGLRDANVDDLAGKVTAQLLLPRNDRPPAIALFSGHGDLTGYLRVSVTREGIRQCKKQRRQPPPRELESIALASDLDDPELAAMKLRYRQQFKAAFHQAISELSSGQRLLLRYHYVHNLTMREIGELVRADDSTITRRLARVRAKLLTSTRSALVQQLDISRGEFHNLLELVETQADLSISRVLGKDES